MEDTFILMFCGGLPLLVVAVMFDDVPLLSIQKLPASTIIKKTHTKNRRASKAGGQRHHSVVPHLTSSNT